MTHFLIAYQKQQRQDGVVADKDVTLAAKGQLAFAGKLDQIDDAARSQAPDRGHQHEEDARQRDHAAGKTLNDVDVQSPTLNLDWNDRIYIYKALNICV